MAQRVLHITADDKLTLPAIDATTQTIVVYGGRGMGKTNFGSVLCEEFDAAGRRFSFIDPMGVAWGLRHSDDGKGKGLDILILGGRHGDLPIEHTGGKVIAEFVATTTKNVLIDISAAADGRRWSVGQKVRFVADYIERLLEVQGEHRQPLMQLIDEAARFAPEMIGFKADKDDPIVRCKEMLGLLVEEGRNGAVGVTLLTQRSARMAKAVSELAEMMVSFRIVGPNSTAAVLDWFGSHVPKARHNELLEQLRTLPRGVALVVAPGWLEYEGVARIRPRHTFDSSATPTGTEKRLASQLKPTDLKDLRARIAETVEKAKADDPRELRKRILELEKQLKVAVQNAPKTKSVEPKRVEVPVLKDGQIARVEKLVDRFGKALDAAMKQHAAIREPLQQLVSAVHSIARAHDQRGERSVHARGLPAIRPDAPVLGAARPERVRQVHHRGDALVRREAPARSVASSNGDLGGPERRIINGLAWWEAAGIAQPSRHQAAFAARYSVNGHFNNIVGNLRANGLVDYPKGDHVSLTDSGRAHAEAPSAPATRDGLIGLVESVLRQEPQRRIFKAMVDAGDGAELSREELAARCNYSVNGHFNNIVGSLKSLGIVTYPRGNHVRLGDMFDALV